MMNIRRGEIYLIDLNPIIGSEQGNIRPCIIIQNDIGKPEFLSHRQIQEMLDSLLIEVGSHTLPHAYLKTMSDNAAKKQIVESKKKLEEEFNIKVETFAYPNGAFNQKTVELVKEASYSAAVSVISGTIQSQENLFFLSRIRQGL